jgi:hypothetical protein
MNQMKWLKPGIIGILFLIGYLFSFQSVFAVNQPYVNWSERGRLISWKHLKTLSQHTIYQKIMEMPWKDTYPTIDLSNLWDFFTPQQLRQVIEYKIDVYQLIYETLDPHGNPTAASGAVLVPRKHPTVGSLLSLQRGTIFLDSDAPSQGSLDNWGIWRGLLPAAAGFFTIMPDYLGYSASKHMVHPYAMANSTATAVIDMILAAKKFAGIISWDLDEKLFLAGLSEGGYATMAAQREIEANYAGILNLTAVAPAAGPYVPSVMLASIFASDYAFAANIVTHILMSYNDTYRFDRPLADFFNPPYDQLLWILQDKTHAENDVESQLPLYTAELYSPTFLSDFRGNGEAELKQAIAANDINSGWIPVAPVRIYSGTNETIVPYVISELLYFGLNQPGTDVQLVPVVGADHLQSIVPITLLTIDWFKTF